MQPPGAKRLFLDLLKSGAIKCGLTDRRALLAVSGGADSVSMLRGLIELRETLRLDLRVAHLNHNLRGDASSADARWVADLCATLHVPLDSGNVDVRSVANASSLGLEEASRRSRYEFLRAIADSTGCACVAVAHTADDQAETILHHILRGTGIDGLGGMPRTRSLAGEILLVRPLLESSRAQIAGYLAEIRQDVRSDETNVDPEFTRNRIRHSLLPQLRRDFNPRVDDALRRLGTQAQELQESLDQRVTGLLSASLEDRQSDVCRLNCEPLANQPRHLVRECFARLWKEQNWPRQLMGFTEWERLAELVLSDAGVDAAETLPGNVEARRRGKLLVLRRQ